MNTVYTLKRRILCRHKIKTRNILEWFYLSQYDIRSYIFVQAYIVHVNTEYTLNWRILYKHMCKIYIYINMEYTLNRLILCRHICTQKYAFIHRCIPSSIILLKKILGVSEANEVPIRNANSSKTFKKIGRKLKYICITILGLAESYLTVTLFDSIFLGKYRRQRPEIMTKSSFNSSSGAIIIWDRYL